MFRVRSAGPGGKSKEQLPLELVKKWRHRAEDEKEHQGRVKVFRKNMRAGEKKLYKGRMI